MDQEKNKTQWLIPGTRQVTIVTASTVVKRLTKEYYKQVYTNKFDNSDEMDTQLWNTQTDH